jgi:hypothetical protein
MKQSFFKNWPRRLSLCLCLCACLTALSAQGEHGYEYWFDDNFTSAVKASENVFDADGFNQSLDISALSDGFHSANFRFRRQGFDSATVWSPVSSFRFFKKTTAAGGNYGYEYWLDGDFINRINQTTAAPNGEAIMVDASVAINNLADGFHEISLRTRSENGWSSVSTYRFFKKTPATGEDVGYEYWVDGDFSNRTKQDLPVSPDDFILIDASAPINNLADGFHEISLRTRSENGWSSVSTYRFFKKTPAAGGDFGYEYWVDGDFSNRTKQVLPVPADEIILIDASAPINSLADGFHEISFRTSSANGWSSVSTFRFFKRNDPVTDASISIWEYWLNNDIAQANRQPIQGANQDKLLFVNDLGIDTLCKGKYLFNYRFFGKNGWSGVLRDTFEKTTRRLGEESADFDLIIDAGQVSFLNKSQNTSHIRWFFGDGTTSELANPFHTYSPGSYIATLVVYGICDNDTLRKQLFIPGISGYTPKRAGRNAAVTVSFSGLGFVQGAMDVRLTRNGYSDLVPASIIVSNSGTMAAKFKFQDAPSGDWDMVVKFPGNITLKFPSGFQIEDSTYFKLSVKISANWRMRIGVNNPLTVTVSNEGNADATMVPLTISGLPKGVKTALVSEQLHLEQLPIFDTIPFSADSIPTTFFDSLTQRSYLPLLLQNVAAGQSMTIQLSIQPPLAADNQWFDVKAEVSTPLWDENTDEPIEGSLGACLYSIFETVALSELADAKSCLTQISTWAYTTIKGAATLGSNKNKAAYFAGMPYGFINLFVKCAKAAGVIIPSSKIVKALEVFLDLYQGAGEVYENCKGPLTKIGIDFSKIRMGGSWDPNVKVGPGNGSAGHFYAAASGPMGYVIQCENDTTALFAAQTVTIIDTLDLSKFDTAFFRFTYVNIGGRFVEINSPKRQFIRDIPLPSGVIARTAGTFDAQKGIISWVISTIDPATGQITTDPLAGILQPNFDPPEGEGAVGFSIAKKESVSDDETIENQAVIIFDFNKPIMTNNWAVISDNVAPVSAIDSLPEMQDSSAVHLSWKGADNKSGIQYYRIFVSDNGGAYFPWKSDFSGVNAVFSGKNGHYYRFYSIAIDSAGNIETAPPVFDATVFISGASLVHSVADNTLKLLVTPNPATHAAILDLELPKTTTLSIDLISAYGQYMLAVCKGTYKAGKQQIPIEWGDRLPSGMYFLKINTPTGVIVKPLVIIR